MELERPEWLAADCAAGAVRHSAREQGRHGKAWSSTPRVVKLTEVITVAGYGALPDVYEWLIPDAMLTPAGAGAAFSELVESLPPNARVLDCACGTGQLAVGLAGLGLDVVAADASDGMIRRTQELADEAGVSLRALHASWDELPDHLDASTFDLVSADVRHSSVLPSQPSCHVAPRYVFSMIEST